MGVTFCAVAPEHPLAIHAASGNAALAAFIEECKAGGTTEAELAVKDKLGRVNNITLEDSVNLWAYITAFNKQSTHPVMKRLLKKIYRNLIEFSKNVDK